MRYLLPVLLLLLFPGRGGTQGGTNPFELRDRPVAAAPDASPAETVTAAADDLIFLHLFLLVFLAGLWVLFRSLLRQCIGAVLNESVMTQLYRRRSEGQVRALWFAYLYFLMIAGLFLFLTIQYFGMDRGWGSLTGWAFSSLVVAAALGVKLVIIHVLGRIYGLRPEVSRYTFVLMVFAIVVGLFLFPLNLLISYSPPAWTPVILAAGATLLVLIYLLHLLRGTFIANRYLSGRPLHFLLYLCTIEIAPILLVYRYLSSTV
jgi:hypothetical protein